MKYYEMFIVFFLTPFDNEYKFQRAVVSLLQVVIHLIFHKTYIIPLEHANDISTVMGNPSLVEPQKIIGYCKELLLHGNVHLIWIHLLHRFQTQFDYFNHIKILGILLVKVILFVFRIDFYFLDDFPSIGVSLSIKWWEWWYNKWNTPEMANSAFLLVL